MNIAVRYYTRSGNTKKVADAIAEELGVESKPVTEPLEEKADILFIGNSLYWGGIDKAVRSFISANKDNIGMLVNVSTASLSESTYSKMEALAKENGIALSEKEFHCRGSFHALHAGRPNDEDLAAARSFAREVAEG